MWCTFWLSSHVGWWPFTGDAGAVIGPMTRSGYVDRKATKGLHRMVGRVESIGDESVAKLRAPPEHTQPETPPDFDLIIDLTETDPQLDLRHSLTPNAALVVASAWKLRVKRLVDVVGAALALVLLSPVLLVAATGVRLTSRGPVFFSQQRTGEHGREFRFFKFRSMALNSEQERDQILDLDETDGPIFKIREDPRMTPIGRLLRRTSIDELPQLWNVLRGDMSLVGPRPLPTEEANQCSDWEAQRLAVRPGITCIWQVSGRSELDFQTWVEMDLRYIEVWSLWYDLKLLARTVPAVLSGRGAY